MKSLACTLLIILPFVLNAQSKWEKILGGTKVDVVSTVIETSDHMLLVAGSSESFHDDDRWAYLAKLDLDGNLAWEYTYNNNSFWNVLEGIVEVGPGQGYLAAGRTWADSCGGETLLMRFSHDGKWLWSRCLPDRGHPTDIQATHDGNFIICNTKSNGITSYDFQITKIDAEANVFWTKVYTSPHWDFAYNVIPTSDNGFAIAGYGGVVVNGQNDALLIKTDENGNELWRLFVGETTSEYGSDVVEMDNGDLLFLGSRPEANGVEMDVFLARVTAAGEMLWIRDYGTVDSYDFGTSLISAEDGGYMILGYSALANYSHERDIQLWKLDSSFAVEWQKTFGGNTEDVPASIIATSDHGYCIAAGSQSFGDENEDIYLIKTDTEGNSQRNLVKGFTYFDKNGSCEYDTLEDPLVDRIGLQFAGKDTLFRFSGGDGSYLTLLDTGSYEISPLTISPYWRFCNFPNTFYFPNAIDTTCIDIPLQAAIECPHLSIDITIPFIRRCFENTIYVHYCNYGTSPAANPVIAVTLDTFYDFQSSTASLLNQVGNTYSFAVPQLDVWECGSFTIVAILNCDAALGETHCVTAHIYPDTLCHPGADSMFMDEECRSNIGSYDPNDKIGFPIGSGENHDITNATEIKYQVRFQNTGTDTAFNIVVIDTLTTNLDWNTFRPGASSHPYTFSLINSAIGKWTFNNILLPDSTTDLAGSMGFLDFFVKPKQGLTRGTAILNSAAIYFDFNAPILTNTTWHTINELSTTTNEPHENNKPEFNFTIAPNPAQDAIRIMLNGNYTSTGNGFICDLYGNKLQSFPVQQSTFEIATSKLKDGLYAVTIPDATGTMHARKLVVLR